MRSPHRPLVSGLTASAWALVLLLAATAPTGCGDEETPGQTNATDTQVADAAPDVESSDIVPVDTSDASIEEDSDSSADTASEDTGPPSCIIGTACNDEDPCTYNDKCVDGYCVGEAYVCDDGRECTADSCDGTGGCLHPVETGWCLIYNVCRHHDESNPANGCERCDVDLDVLAWTERADDSSCEDGNPCTFGDYCKKGVCTRGLNTTCDDGNECTADSCDTSLGCRNEPISAACDDGNKCTETSVCSGGTCHSPVADCDDDNPCTTDTCLPDLGCEHVPFEGPCDDGNACTEGDTCVDSACVPGTPLDCDDGSECTVDACDPLFGCWVSIDPNPCCSGAVHLCDDDDPCTADSCDPDTLECVNTPGDLPCDDGNPCTLGDRCSGGVCQPGTASACDDGNPCTNDSCSPAAGCQHAPSVGACDDGIDCTTNDTCIGGQCVGDSSECVCTPDFSPAVGKAVSMSVGEQALGLDVDQDPSTCSPEPCTNGIDNSLSILGSMMNEPLDGEIVKGTLVLLFELVDPTTDGSPFSMRLYAGRRASSTCPPDQAGCPYLIESVMLDDDCLPVVQLDNATITAGRLRAGGPGYDFPLSIPVFGDIVLPVTLAFGTIEADVTLSGNTIATMENGVLAGAIAKETFVTALEYVDPADLPVPKENIVQLLDLLVQNDIDTKPPTGPDAASIGIQFEAVGVELVGVAN